MEDNSDDYDFTPSSGSNLASLFDSTTLSSERPTLSYTAPKQPKPGGPDRTPETAKPSESSVICARVVQVWKLTDGKYVAVGKQGFAIIGSSTQNSYEIILYKEKRNVIVRVKVDQNLEISVKKDDFVSFFDSAEDNWLIKFPSQEDCKVVITYVEKLGCKVVTAVEEKKSKQSQENVTASEGDSNENKVKADILSRIAKMGQSILPNKNSEVEESLDNSEPDISEVKFCKNQVVSSSPIVQVPRPVQNIPSTFVVGQSMPYDPLSLYFTENRTHNTEVRMNLSQISEKLNNIVRLIDTEKTTDSNTDTLKSKVKVLDLRIENLSRELAVSQQENKILREQISQQENVLKNSEQYKMDLQRVKEKNRAEMDELQEQVNVYKINIEELSKKIEDLTKQIVEKDNAIDYVEQKLKAFEERKETTKLNDDDNKEKNANFVVILKDAMNNLYGTIMDSFKGEPASEVNSIIAHNIKSTTLNIMQHFHQIYRTPSEQN